MSGFNHSVKVPTQYKRIAAVIKKSLETRQSIKSLIFEEKHAHMSRMQAILTLYTKNCTEINRAIGKSKILEENPQLRKELCIVLVTELLLGRKSLHSECKPVRTVREYKDKLQAALGEEAIDEKKGLVKPRYVRVNTNKLSMDEAFEFLAKNKWQRSTTTFQTYAEYLEAISNMKEDEFLVDIHVDTLLVFHKKWRQFWAKHEFVQEKKFLLQDKGTCLVAELLQPAPGSTLLDMCAAPGMKTIHASNVMQNKGKIYAVERSLERYQTLCEMTTLAEANIVETIHSDALLITSSKCPSVEYILVDPSCSGIGMQNRLSVIPEEKDPKRLYKLAGLQVKMLEHAMRAFPDVKRIAYSTCSLYQEENEEVVQRCLKTCPQFKLLSAKKALRNKWTHVGSPEFKKIGKKCIYSRPNEDFTDGIFVAIFERSKDGDADDE